MICSMPYGMLKATLALRILRFGKFSNHLISVQQTGLQGGLLLYDACEEAR